MFLDKLFGNKGILGINARNLLYLKPYNPQKAIKMADDKVKTKQYLSTRGIPVPRLYKIIRNNKELENFNLNSLPNSFVIKPNKGYGGEGIIPIIEKKGTKWITISGKQLSKEDIFNHIREILDGRYSISNVGDTAFFEQLIVADPIVGKYSYGGLPDIRVVVHNLIPVMAMLRLPTKESEGKANLHMGAVGIGIDIAKGQATHIVYKNKIIDELPDGLGKIKGFKIPHWNEILTIASRCQLITNLGYLAADICIDKNTGPLLLEINARAGLGVQIANLAPLRKRLERIQGVKVTNPTKGVRIAKDMFGNVVEKEIQNISGKQIIKTKESVELILKSGKVKLKAQINTSKQRSIIDEKVAENLGLLDNSTNYDEEKSQLKIKFSLKGKRLQTVVDVEEVPSKEIKFVLGNRDLTEFLIDTSIRKKSPTKNSNEEILNKKDLDISDENLKENYYQKIDRDIINIDKRIKLLYHLTPINLQSEKEKFLKNPNFNPQFEYPKVIFDEMELINNLSKIKTDDSPIGKLFQAKKEEVLKKIKIITSIGEDEFTENSISLYGKPTEKNVEICKNYIKHIDTKNKKHSALIYNANDLKEKFEEVLKSHNINNWQIKIKENLIPTCVTNKNNKLLIKNIKFSREKIENLIVHEIETHLFTNENGKNQKYEMFKYGFANYLKTQEGIAMYNEEQQNTISIQKNFKVQSFVIAIALALNISFLELHKTLVEKYKMTKLSAFGTCLKVKRGLKDTSKAGAFTKDHIYFEGYLQVKEFMDNGGDLKDLYIGKFNLDDLEIIKNIENLKEPQIMPKWYKPNK